MPGRPPALQSACPCSRDTERPCACGLIRAAAWHRIGRAVMGNLLPIVCILASAWVAASGHDGWGWFLFLALLLA